MTLPLNGMNVTEFGGHILKLSPIIGTQLKFGATKSGR